jgi:DNA adenine methylase
MGKSDRLTPVDPVRPVAGYIGGKRRLAARLVELIAATPHRTYAEAFVGMGGVFFRRHSRPPVEVINDRNGEVANLFRILQRHYPQFMETLRFQITSRREFERLKASDPATLTDLERAGRFLYLQRTAFGGKVAGQTFGVDPRSGGGFNLTRLAPVLEEVHERLAGVVIEGLDWSAFIDRYDRPETLFYLDPPYHGSEDDYGKGLFLRDQFEALASRLAALQGRFILSINDVPETRKAFRRFAIQPVDLVYSIHGGKPSAARELIVSSGRSGRTKSAASR